MFYSISGNIHCTNKTATTKHNITPNCITAVQTEQCHAFSILKSSCLVSTEKYRESCPDVCTKKQCCRSSTFSESLTIRNIVWYTLNISGHLFQSWTFNCKRIVLLWRHMRTGTSVKLIFSRFFILVLTLFGIFLLVTICFKSLYSTKCGF